MTARLAPGPAAARAASVPAADLRPATEVMRLARLGAFHATRLSFARVLLRRAAEEGWQFDRPVWRIDPQGEGLAIYRVRTAGHVYSLVAFAHDLPPEKRSDRVIADAWDATFTLFDGEPDAGDLARLARNVPLQEAGRVSARELTLSRANRSVRLFNGVVERLAAGTQPDAALVRAVGYLMRTTAVYGSGKFGLADREIIAERPEFSGPFGAEMLTVWLIRSFTADLVEHMAACRAPKRAVRLDPALRRRLGVGNSTGLGMAPFVVHHAGLLHRWITARETALARVLALPTASPDEMRRFETRLDATIAEIETWIVPDAAQAARNERLAADLRGLLRRMQATGVGGPQPWRRVLDLAEAHAEAEAQEILVSTLIELHGPLVDDLSGTMAGDERPERRIDGSWTLRQLGDALRARYDFALAGDFDPPTADAYFWYVSEEKLEPRLGVRATEPGAELEQPLTAARDARRLADILAALPSEETVAAFLLRHPEMRHLVRRVQFAAEHPYAEIRDNLLDGAMRPIDLLRCKLSFLGAARFDPKSDRWMRISLFADMPYPNEICEAFDAGAPSRGEPDPLPPPPGKDDRIVLSLNEIDAELRKAARGAGLSWGEAEEVGLAARRLARSGIDALEALSDVLEGHLEARFDAPAIGRGATVANRAASPLALGIALLDRAHELAEGEILECGPVERPLLLLPFLADLAERLGRAIEIGWDDVRIVHGARLDPSMVAAFRMSARVERVTVSARSEAFHRADEKEPPFRGLAAAPSTWGRLNRLAARTYVPSSAISRLNGAGSGTLGEEND